MSYTVTNIFATQSGNVPASQIDTNFTNVLSGINNAYLVGTLAARPAPDGVGNGRYYFATDSNGGTLYRDNGTSWVAVGAGVTLTASQFGNQSANVVLAGPSSGAAAAPTFRALVAADISAGIIHQSALSTSTGAAGSGAGASLTVTLNDYSFFPSLTNTSSNATLATNATADPGNTVGQVFVAAGAGGSFTTVRWRYINTSFNPSVWGLYDPLTGMIQAVWESEDPIPSGECPIASGGLPSLEFILPDDLDSLDSALVYMDSGNGNISYTSSSYLTEKVYRSHPEIAQNEGRVRQIRRWVALRALAQARNQSTADLIKARYKIVSGVLTLQ